jgi:hypothetical protein
LIRAAELGVGYVEMLSEYVRDTGFCGLVTFCDEEVCIGAKGDCAKAFGSNGESEFEGTGVVKVKGLELVAAEPNPLKPENFTLSAWGRRVKHVKHL